MTKAERRREMCRKARSYNKGMVSYHPDCFPVDFPAILDHINALEAELRRKTEVFTAKVAVLEKLLVVRADNIDDWEKAYTKLKAENERLRTALGRIT